MAKREVMARHKSTSAAWEEREQVEHTKKGKSHATWKSQKRRRGLLTSAPGGLRKKQTEQKEIPASVRSHAP